MPLTTCALREVGVPLGRASPTRGQRITSRYARGVKRQVKSDISCCLWPALSCATSLRVDPPYIFKGVGLGGRAPPGCAQGERARAADHRASAGGLSAKLRAAPSAAF